MRRPGSCAAIPLHAVVLLLAAMLAGAPELRAAPGEPGARGTPGTPGDSPWDGAALDPLSIIGIGLEDAARRFGVPDRVFPLRGEEPWQDDVVFYYASGLHLFWYEDRVWQVRLDVHYGGEVLQLRIGASREQARGILGPPWREEEDALVYLLEDRGYPIRMRLYFEGGLLVDVYCYRGDL